MSLRSTGSAPKHNPRQPIRRGLKERVYRIWRGRKRIPILTLAFAWLLFLGYGLLDFLSQSSYFQLSTISIENVERLNSEDVKLYLREVAGVGEGANLLRISSAHLQKTLHQIPEVAYCDVVKVWPDRIDIYLEEREAAGILVSSNGALVFDDAGFLFSPASPSDFRDSDLSIISGLEKEDYEPGVSIDSETLSWLKTYQKTMTAAAPSLAGRISEYHIEGDGLTLVLDNGVRYLCGTRPAETTGPIIEAIEKNYEDDEFTKAILVADSHVILSNGEPAIPAATVAQTR